MVYLTLLKMSKAENEIRRDRSQIMQDLKEEREQLVKMAQLTSQKPRYKILKDMKKDESTSHKNKATKKRKKLKSKKSKRHCDDESDSTSDRQNRIKREKNTKSQYEKCSAISRDRKREKKKKRKHSETETSCSESDEWVEKGIESQPEVRSISEWMTEGFCLKTFSNIKSDNDKNAPNESYNPRQDKRELNTYWKTTGTGLPATFIKPKDNDETEKSLHFQKQVLGFNVGSRRNWQKCEPNERDQRDKMLVEESINSDAINMTQAKHGEGINRKKETNEGKYVTNQELNELGAKVVKAELLGNVELAKELQEKLERARNQRKICIDKGKEESFVPSEKHAASVKRGNPMIYSDPYGGRRKKSNKKTGAEIEHCVNFMDEKYDIKEMFKSEKSSTNSTKRNNYHKACNDEVSNEGNFRHSTKLNDCNKCLNDDRMDKSAIVCIGEYSYLALPWHIGLQPGHCILAPIQHTSCSTLLDENVWEEITNFRKALTEMYAAQRKDIIFFEIAKKCRSDAHLNIHCIPIKDNEAEIAPFYFKKAIEESEHEWSINKQLIKLQNSKNVRNSIPKGVPYFWVNFGMANGFAHVIEDQECFPVNFAQKIIGGFLNLDPQKWRRPQKEHSLVAKVKIFSDLWEKYNFLDTERKAKNI